MADLKDRLAQTHPLYDAHQQSWLLYRDSYIGGTRYIENRAYLFKHFREDQGDYADRLRRAVYPNFCRRVIDTYNAFIFREPISRVPHGDDAAFKAFESDADLRGTSLTQFMSEEVQKPASIYGHVVVLVDLPSTDVAPATRLDDAKLGMRPYVTAYSPLDVVDWALDGDGDYTYVRFREEAGDESTWDADRKEPRCIYRTWTQTEWLIHDDTGALLRSGTHDLGVVPAVRVPILPDMDCPELGQSILADIALLNRAVYNYRSLLDEFLYRQCFNILGIPTTGSMTKEKIEEWLKEFGTTRGFFYDGTGAPPSYVSPPVSPAEFLLKTMETTAQEIVELAKLQDRSATQKTASGIARAYEFQESNSAFTKIARNLQASEEKIIWLFYRWKDATVRPNEVPVAVEYPTDFNLRTLAEEIDDALALLTMQISPTFNAEIRKRVAEQALPEADDATEKKIRDEIDAAPADDALQREAASVRATLDAAPDAADAPPAPAPMPVPPAAPTAAQDACGCCEAEECPCDCPCCAGDGCTCACPACTDGTGDCTCACACCAEEAPMTAKTHGAEEAQ